MHETAPRHHDTPARSAASLGYRLPAEWATHAAVWVAPPHNAETWPGCLDRAQRQFEDMTTAIARYTPVQTTEAHGIATNDSWMRDFGPIFVTRPTPGDAAHRSDGTRERAAHDFVFNGWGGKYEQRDADDRVPRRIAAQLGLPCWSHELVLEGGAIDTNGAGVLMTTAPCLLEAGRNPQLRRAQLERALHEAFGTCQMLYLPAGIAGDDTDGHIDDAARFIDERTIVHATALPDHPDHAALERNRAALQSARNLDGEPFELIALPSPEPMHFDYPPDRFGPGGRLPLPASYANFLITNDAALVPTFGQRTDDEALATLARAMPRHTIEPVRSDWLIVGRGALHCLTMPEPAAEIGKQPSPRATDLPG